MSLVGQAGSLFMLAPQGGVENVMYIGGTFSGLSSVRASDRNRAAAVSADVTANTDAMVEAWDPNCEPSSAAHSFVLSGPNIYIHGGFTTVRGTTRNRAACVDSDVTQANPTLRAWNPDVNGTIRTMILSGDNMYLCGHFSEVRGTGRRCYACVDSDVTAASPTLRAWDPDTSGLGVGMFLA